MDIKTMQKYDMERAFKEKLKLFFIIVRFAHIQKERVVGVVAYKQEDAMRKMDDDYKDQSGVSFVSYGDFVLIEEILSSINVKGVVIKQSIPLTPKFEKDSEPQPVLGVGAFKSSLLLVLNEYVKEGKDQKELRRIVSNIK